MGVLTIPILLPQSGNTKSRIRDSPTAHYAKRIGTSYSMAFIISPMFHLINVITKFLSYPKMTDRLNKSKIKFKSFHS